VRFASRPSLRAKRPVKRPGGVTPLGDGTVTLGSEDGTLGRGHARARLVVLH